MTSVGMTKKGRKQVLMNIAERVQRASEDEKDIVMEEERR